MKLEIILQLLYTNDLQDVVARAVQIENSISLPYAVGDLILVSVSKHDLPLGKTFKGNEYNGLLLLPVAAINVYSIAKPYLVTLPNGKTEWASASSGRNAPVELIDVADLAPRVDVR